MRFGVVWEQVDEIWGALRETKAALGLFGGDLGPKRRRSEAASLSLPFCSHPNLVWGRSSLAQHLTTLLASSDMQVVLAVLNLLYVFSKRSNYITRLGSDKRSPLLSRLQHLAEVRHPWVGLGGGRWDGGGEMGGVGGDGIEGGRWEVWGEDVWGEMGCVG